MLSWTFFPRRVFWLQDTWDDDRVLRADMDGLNSNVTQIYARTPANRNLWGLALDTDNERLWITEREGTCYDSDIRRMTFDGSATTVVVSPVCNPHDIEYVNGRIIWGEKAGIVSADPDGSSLDTVVAGAVVYGLAVDGTWGRIYRTDYTSDVIRRVDFGGENAMSIVGDLNQFTGVAMDYSPTAVSVEPRLAGPRAYGLPQNYPNPFHPTTTITWDLPERSAVVLSVFNTLGRLVATLADAQMEPGHHPAEFDASRIGRRRVHLLPARGYTYAVTQDGPGPVTGGHRSVVPPAPMKIGA